MIKKCGNELCSNTFVQETGPGRPKKYCASCGRQKKVVGVKMCENPRCYNTFVVKKTGRPRKYCSSGCNSRTNRRKHGQNTVPINTTVKDKCGGCNKYFYYKYKGKRRAYCSYECKWKRNEARRAYERKERGGRKKKVVHNQVCDCGRDYLSVPLDEQYLGCPHVKITPRRDNAPVPTVW